MGGSRRFRQGALTSFFSHQRISQSAVRNSLEKQLDPRGPISLRWGSVPVLPRKTIATCDFPGVGRGSESPVPPLDQPMP